MSYRSNNRTKYRKYDKNIVCAATYRTTVNKYVCVREGGRGELSAGCRRTSRRSGSGGGRPPWSKLNYTSSSLNTRRTRNENREWVSCTRFPCRRDAVVVRDDFIWTFPCPGRTTTGGRSKASGRDSGGVTVWRRSRERLPRAK